MPTARRRRTTRTAAIVASVIAHVGLLTALLLYKPVLFIPEEPGGPPEAIIPVLLMPRTPPAAAGGAPQGQLRLHRRAQRFAPVPPQVTPLVTAAPIAAAPAAPTPAPAAPSPSSAPAPGPDIRTALRHGVVGCANLASLSLTERDLCDERLGKGVTAEAYIPAPINPAKRAYYDAVLDARKVGPQPVQMRPIGRETMWETDGRGMTGHGPHVGCHIAFGPGRKPAGPPHALNLGPCFIEPPQGPLTVEADITPP